MKDSERMEEQVRLRVALRELEGAVSARDHGRRSTFIKKLDTALALLMAIKQGMRGPLADFFEEREQEGGRVNARTAKVSKLQD